MSLSNYAEACTGFLWELKESLTTEDLDGLRADCAALGYESWNHWVKENSADILEFVSATPSRRRTIKRCRDETRRRRMVLAAIQFLLAARVLITKIDEYNLKPGGSYRDLAACAALAYLKIFSENIPSWPLSGENPFTKISTG